MPCCAAVVSADVQLAPCVIPTLILTLIESVRCVVLVVVLLDSRKRRERERKKQTNEKQSGRCKALLLNDDWML